MEFLDQVVLGNAVRDWLLAGGIFLAILATYSLIARFLVDRVASLAAQTQTSLDDALDAAIRQTKPLLLFGLALYFASRPLDLSDRAQTWLEVLVIASILLQAGFWIVAWLQVLLESWKHKRWGDDAGANSTFRLVELAVKIAVWAVIFLLLLENLGVDISALVAGLGIGGIAVALAVQSILGDLFASLTILLDKPFVEGDFLAVGDLKGTVESIGLNTTRLTSLSGEQLVFSNKDLVQARIRNYGRMEERRADFRIGVEYGTPPEIVERIPSMIREAIEAHALARFDRSHFSTFGDSALVVDTVFYMTVPDYQTYMDVQQTVNLELLRRFAEEGIEFAYPTRRLYLETVDPTFRDGRADRRVRTDSG